MGRKRPATSAQAFCSPLIPALMSFFIFQAPGAFWNLPFSWMRAVVTDPISGSRGGARRGSLLLLSCKAAFSPLLSSTQIQRWRICPWDGEGHFPSPVTRPVVTAQQPHGIMRGTSRSCRAPCAPCVCSSCLKFLVLMNCEKLTDQGQWI